MLVNVIFTPFSKCNYSVFFCKFCSNLQCNFANPENKNKIRFMEFSYCAEMFEFSLATFFCKTSNKVNLVFFLFTKKQDLLSRPIKDVSLKSKQKTLTQDKFIFFVCFCSGAQYAAP